jgi:anti-sigma regulatory factor (Ser/Thr protein kinase)
MSSDGLILSLPRNAASVASGRTAVDRFKEPVAEKWETLRLLVSELLTNAVVHGEGETMRLVLRIEHGVCRVEVIDGGNGFTPTATLPSPLAPGGRGLFLVDALSDDWGVYNGRSTHVWFELKL